jgi:hypothetical protein
MILSTTSRADVLQCANIYGPLQALAWDVTRDIYLFAKRQAANITLIHKIILIIKCDLFKLIIFHF